MSKRAEFSDRGSRSGKTQRMRVYSLHPEHVEAISAALEVAHAINRGQSRRRGQRAGPGGVMGQRLCLGQCRLKWDAIPGTERATPDWGEYLLSVAWCMRPVQEMPHAEAHSCRVGLRARRFR
jgi:hypothetical protein